MKHAIIIISLFTMVIAVITSVFTGCDQEPEETGMEMPAGPAFGGDADIALANTLWTGIQGYRDWRLQSDYYSSDSVHGEVVRMYYSIVNANGAPHHVIIKENYRGEQITPEMVAQNPSEYLDAVALMVQREEGYDPGNQNWYWARYNPDGTLGTNEQGTQLAGRVPVCIDCHMKAAGGDLYFTNDQQ